MSPWASAPSERRSRALSSARIATNAKSAADAAAASKTHGGNGGTASNTTSMDRAKATARTPIKVHTGDSTRTCDTDGDMRFPSADGAQIVIDSMTHAPAELDTNEAIAEMRHRAGGWSRQGRWQPGTIQEPLLPHAYAARPLPPPPPRRSNAGRHPRIPCTTRYPGAAAPWQQIPSKRRNAPRLRQPQRPRPHARHRHIQRLNLPKRAVPQWQDRTCTAARWTPALRRPTAATRNNSLVSFGNLCNSFSSSARATRCEAPCRPRHPLERLRSRALRSSALAVVAPQTAACHISMHIGASTAFAAKDGANTSAPEHLHTSDTAASNPLLR